MYQAIKCISFHFKGKCNKQATCPYIHDPSKIAVCTKFLRGRCKNTDGSCPFSHKIDRDKMPVCQFFLRGKCSNDNCPYSHVNVSKKAEVCEDFLKGFCSRGQQCNKKHILECEEFSQTGKCSKGTKCKLMHRTRKSTTSRKREPTSNEEMASDSLKRPKLEFTNEEGFLPLQATTSGK
ncbi:zinc finger CCCH domain-containing protein 3-like [Acropora millepora]|uniref:zinc finger CCCH domain-containing protein 3-like n=1 Tax=Acropora millepora TaxID=45264 RepID=UPI001CF4BED6|nr:zinc finger CCCH domain-containing protein 3-like [Acropora millepora]